MNVRNRVSICTLIIGLIYPSTQLARGQQSDPVQPPPFGINRRKVRKFRSIVREVGYGLSLEAASAADPVQSMQAKAQSGAGKGKVA